VLYVQLLQTTVFQINLIQPHAIQQSVPVSCGSPNTPIEALMFPRQGATRPRRASFFFFWEIGVCFFCVNVTKSACYPINCHGIDVEQLLQNFNCPVKTFPCTYLGLPLHFKRLPRVEVQPLVEKVAARLPTWKGKFLNKAGRLKLLNAVLTSIPMHFLTVFAINKWAIKRIDKIRRSFLWKGSAEANGGHCLVRWAKVMRPKKFGGLSVLDLELFGRALRLRWLWLEWTDQERPWVGTTVPCDAVDRQLFRISTVVIIGDGCKASFWHSSWLDGRAPIDIAPGLYKLAWRKHRKVKEELQDQKWTRGLWRMTTVQEMAEFVILWDLVQQVQLTDGTDEIRWRWTADGIYTSKSAYLAQFNGSYSTYNGNDLWKAQAEGKHKFFSWLLLQTKILTADKLIKRNWPCDPVCKLCDQEQETAIHLCLGCVYAREVWTLMEDWSGGLVRVPEQGLQIEDWWRNLLMHLPKKERRVAAALLMYTVWNIWKERN